MSSVLRIGTARDLIEALEADDLSLLLAVHRTISRDPVRALAFGRWEGRDVVDVLVALADGGKDGMAGLACGTLAAFEEERVLAFFLRQLGQGQGIHLETAVAWLQSHRQLFERSAVYGALLQNASLARVRGVARLLTPEPADPPEVTLRLALLTVGAPLPALDDTTRPLWRAELGGVLVAEARAALRSFGRPAFEWLCALREELSDPTLSWLLGWGVRSWPEACIGAVGELLADPRRVSLGLQCVESAPALASALPEELRRLATDPQHGLRAIRAGAPVDMAHVATDASCSGELRAVCLQRWTDAPLPILLECLRDADWRVRAAAGDVLTARGGNDTIEAMQPLLTGEADAVRAAAVQVLAALGCHALVEEALLTP